MEKEIAHLNNGKSRSETASKSIASKRSNALAIRKPPVQRKVNNTGLPNQLKFGIENLSGHSMDDVKVHYNSPKPAQLHAHAYAQGNQIHLGPGQQKHLPHEAWHVVQQKQGRVKPTMQLKSKVNINDNAGLEKEADVMGALAINQGSVSKRYSNSNDLKTETPPGNVKQGLFGEIVGAAGSLLNAGAAVGAAVGGVAGGYAKDYLGTFGGAVVGGIAGGIAGGLTTGLYGAASGAISGAAVGAAGGVKESVNTVKKYVPYASDAASIAASSSAAYFAVTALPVTTPIVFTYLVGGVTYSVSEHITGTVIDIVSHGGQLPGPAIFKGMFISALSGAVVAGPAGVLHMISPGLAAVSTVPLTYGVGLPGLMWGRHTTLKSRVGAAGMPHQPRETALAFGMDNKSRDLDYKNWARAHGAVTYRYFFTYFDQDWVQTLDHITKKADKIYVNLGGYQIEGYGGPGHPSFADIESNIQHYLSQREVRMGRGKHIIPAHGFTNFEIAYLLSHEHQLDGKLVWWNRDKVMARPKISKA